MESAVTLKKHFKVCRLFVFGIKFVRMLRRFISFKCYFIMRLFSRNWNLSNKFESLAKRRKRDENDEKKIAVKICPKKKTKKTNEYMFGVHNIIPQEFEKLPSENKFLRKKKYYKIHLDVDEGNVEATRYQGRWRKSGQNAVAIAYSAALRFPPKRQRSLLATRLSSSLQLAVSIAR